MFAVFAGHGDVRGDHPTQLDDVGEVVLVPGVVVPGVGLEQVVPRGQLEGHTGRGPDVCRRSVPRPQQHLQRSVLSGLDILRVVMILKMDKIMTENNFLIILDLTSQQAFPRSAILHLSSATTS